MSDATDNIVQLSDLRYSWPRQQHPVIAIADFEIARGERVFLRGPSGSGKTTLLSLIAAVLTPQAGTITVDGVALDSLRGGKRDQFRVDRIGLVFQQFNLLPFLSVRDNILLPCRFSARRRARAAAQGQTASEEASRLLASMQLPDTILSQSVNQLSVGQQQRVAVARALIGRPPLIIADEPTSALDSDTRQAFLELLFAEIKASACSLLFVSHDNALADNFDRHLDLRDINAASRADDSVGISL